MKLLPRQKIADFLYHRASLADAAERAQENAEKMAERLFPYAEKAGNAAVGLLEKLLLLNEKIKEKKENSPIIRKIGKFFLLPCALLCIWGCKTTLPEGTDCHIVAADHNGDPVFFDCADAKGKIVRRADSITLKEHLARMSRAMEKSGRKKIFLYCFGGMNSVNDTVGISAVNTPIIMNDSDMYPIFVNWESELFACYFHNLVWVRQGVENPWFGPSLVPFYFMADTIASICRLPIDMVYQSAGVFTIRAAKGYNETAQMLQSQDAGIRCCLGRDNDPHTILPLVRLGYFAGCPFRVFTTSLITVFGSKAWGEMRRRARLAFDKDQSPDMERIPTSSDGVLADFAEMLQDYAKKHPDTEITLAGHSMGSFLVTEFLTRYPDLPVKNIVFMASASSVQETVQVVKPYLEKNRDAQFYNLCLHPFVDWFDMMNYCVLPCGSILSWVTLHLTTPISKEEHPVGLWDTSIFLLPRLMKGVEKQVSLKAFGLYDPATNTEVLKMPHQHTDFSNPRVKFWKKKFWEIPLQKTDRKRSGKQ